MRTKHIRKMQDYEYITALEKELAAEKRKIARLREALEICRVGLTETVERYDCYHCPKKPCTLADNCSGFYAQNAMHDALSALDGGRDE